MVAAHHAENIGFGEVNGVAGSAQPESARRGIGAEMQRFCQDHIRSGLDHGAAGNPHIGVAEVVAQEPIAEVDRIGGRIVELNPVIGSGHVKTHDLIDNHTILAWGQIIGSRRSARLRAGTPAGDVIRRRIIFIDQHQGRAVAVRGGGPGCLVIIGHADDLCAAVGAAQPDFLPRIIQFRCAVEVNTIIGDARIGVGKPRRAFGQHKESVGSQEGAARETEPVVVHIQAAKV